MKTAKKDVVSVEIICPYCGEAQHDPSGGSLFWEVIQVHSGEIRKCWDCGKQFKLPKY